MGAAVTRVVGLLHLYT